VLSSCNAGWGKQLTRATYKKAGRPLLKFARRNALKWRRMIMDIDMGFPAALAVNKEVLLEHGMPEEFAGDALLLEIQRRISDGGLRVVCAKDSYVHVTDANVTAWEAERESVLNLIGARRAVRENEVDRALAYLDSAITSKPGYTEALYERGLLRALKGMDGDAAHDFESVLRAKPSDSRAHNNLGCIHFKNGNAEDAETSFKTAIEVDTGNWEAKKNLADLYMCTGRSRLAADLYSSIMEEHSQCPDVYASLGEVFAAHGDLATAEELFRIALRLSPGNVAAKQGLGAVELARGNLAMAGGDRVGGPRNKTVGLHDSKG
jgi:Flp pilus assembly protein TadD